MAYNAAILLDSINNRGERLTTFEVTLPRIVLAEFNTHRMLSRNSASSRAIPVEKQLTKILDDPFIPAYWGVNQPGMQSGEELSTEEQVEARRIWLHQRNAAVVGAVALIGGVSLLKSEDLRERIAAIEQKGQVPVTPLPRPLHKQIANRLLEPFMWHTIIATATDYDNFFALRAHPDAQPEIRIAAEMMKDRYVGSVPDELGSNQWHLPLIQPDERDLPLEVLKKVSAGRCARVSYLTHMGTRSIAEDIGLHDRLASSGHMSPLEHVARPMKRRERFPRRRYSGNFRGWRQYRKDFRYEGNYAKVRDSDSKRIAA